MHRNWLSGIRRYCLLSGVVLVASAGLCRAGDNDAELRALIEQQGRQIQELKQQIQVNQVHPVGADSPAKLDDDAVKKIVGTYLQEQDAKKKAADAQKKEEGFKVGTDLNNITARWNLANGVTFETPNKDFVSHIGFRFQQDFVWFEQPDKMIGPGGVGDLQDGAFMRRVRPSWDGTAWEVLEWNCEVALEQTQKSISNFDEVWVGVTKLPCIGSVQVGHHKVPQGFEGDMVSSSKAMTFLERAAYTDAFYENFATGIWAGNNCLDQRMTWAAMAYRQDNPRENSDADFADGAYGYTGRLTFLPIYACNGRHLLHLGISNTWRNNEKADSTITVAGNAASGPRLAQFRARPELRDAMGDFGTVGNPGNAVRWVDTGTFASPSTDVLGTELFCVLGPLSFQAEYAWACPDVTGQDISFNGGYVEVSYFLTGENRIYDRRYGREGSTYIAAPFTPFWGVRTEDGRFSFGSGAWEIAARYSHLDLNSGPIHGGVLDGVTVGLNWYLNVNAKVQFQYLHQERSDLRTTGSEPLPVSGGMDSLGIRTQFFF